PFEKASFTTRRSPSNSASMNKVRALALLTLALLSSAAMEDLVWGAQPLRAKHAMVTSGETNATEAGLSVLKSGGNAMDPAVALASVLGVPPSGMCGLGGGGYALVRMADGRAAFFDFRERAPAKASRDMFTLPDGKLSPDSLRGWRAAAVPGTVKGFETAHRKFGRQPWAGLLKPAIRLALDGHPLSWGRAQSFRQSKTLLEF